jgi:hypothetical protein
VPVGEADVGGRPAAAGQGAVHHVVVDQGAGVHELQRRHGPQHGGVVLRGTGDGLDRAAPAPVGEGRAQALAAVGDGGDLVDDRAEGGVHAGEDGALLLEEPAERGGDRAADARQVGAGQRCAAQGRRRAGRGLATLRPGDHGASIAPGCAAPPVRAGERVRGHAGGLLVP